MSWTQQIFNYCERATNPALWAEPLNAITNLAFILAAALAFQHARKQPRGTCGYFHYTLIIVVFLIGIGSGLFHTFATRWGIIADVVPIGIFIFLYQIFAMQKFLKLQIIGISIGIFAFIITSYITSNIKCTGGPCLNGTIGYVPALLALTTLGLLALAKKSKAAISLLSAALIFTGSTFFRSIDLSLCKDITIAGYQTGTHFIWHMLNALTLYILLRAAILYGHTTPKNEKN